MGTKYKTDQGDTWDIISRRFYGRESLFPLIMIANPKHMHTVFFSANVELEIPDLPTPKKSTLDPPWSD